MSCLEVLNEKTYNTLIIDEALTVFQTAVKIILLVKWIYL